MNERDLEIAVLRALSRSFGGTIRDIRKPPDRDRLHFFSGKIEQVDALKLAVLGTDSAVGKRTTAWLLVHGLQARGSRAALVGTGQTAWLQGARHGVVMDSLVNDFVAGELEHATYQAWVERKPDVIVIEGQGSLMNPAYPGGFEILAAGRPDVVVLQHAPARAEYDGFPGHPLHPLTTQIQAVSPSRRSTQRSGRQQSGDHDAALEWIDAHECQQDSHGGGFLGVIKIYRNGVMGNVFED